MTLEPWLVTIRQNVWVTFANLTNQSSFCLALASPSDPFRICLIGLGDLQDWKSFQDYVNDTSCLSGPKNATGIQTLITALNRTGPDPEELDIMATPGNNSCVRFSLLGNGNVISALQGLVTNFFIQYLGRDRMGKWINHTGMQDVSPRDYGYDNTTWWCGERLKIVETSKVATPKLLPPGIFLIWGDQAWPGIPACPIGGPCTLGRLTTFAPSMHQLLNNTTQRVRKKRTLETYGENCNSEVINWNVAERVLMSLFAPHIGVAKALGNIDKLSCLVAKQNNLTSFLLSELALDVGSIRHVTLQNRAAIDFIVSSWTQL